MQPQMYANILIWGLIIPLIAIRCSVKTEPVLWPILLIGFLGEAVPCLMLFYWFWGGLFALLFAAHLLMYARVYRRYQINIRAARHTPPWAEHKLEIQRALDSRPAGYHRPDVVAQRTGELPQIKKKS